MWPQLIDMTKEESMQNLRSLELEAYAGLVTALRAQGPLNQSKLKVLKEICALLNITQERHKAEIRRAVNDEKLNTIAYHVCGHNTYSDDWAQEGRWLVPLMHRATPQTVFSIIADENSDAASATNKQLPLPSMTERKRNQILHSQGNAGIDGKGIGYRSSETPKLEECRKRKFPFSTENSGIVQYSMGSPKISKIQQIYRQRTKARIKDQQQQLHQQLKIKQEPEQKDTSSKKLFSAMQGMLLPQTNFKLPLSPQLSSPKINVLQNITVPSAKLEGKDEAVDEQTETENEEVETLSPQPSCSNENQVPKSLQKSVTSIKSNQGVIVKSGDVHKPIKLCPKKTIAKSAGQKLVVVSTPQPVAPSMLHRALTVPVVKSLDKFKIVSTSAGTTTTFPLTAVKNTGTLNKHKVVTVRTNTLPKKVSLSHLQFLNAKGSIKVLPFGGKIVTKSTTIPTSNLIIMNSGDTKNTINTMSSTHVISSTKVQEPFSIKPADSVAETQSNNEPKSSVLAEILKASGVTAEDSETIDEEIDSSQELTLKAEQSPEYQEKLEQGITTKEITDEQRVVEVEHMEEDKELDEISVEHLICEEGNLDHNEDSVREIENTYTILGEQTGMDEIIMHDELNSPNMEIEDTKIVNTNEDILQQCLINEGITCDKISSDDVTPINAEKVF